MSYALRRARLAEVQRQAHVRKYEHKARPSGPPKHVNSNWDHGFHRIGIDLYYVSTSRKLYLLQTFKITFGNTTLTKIADCRFSKSYEHPSVKKYGRKRRSILPLQVDPEAWEAALRVEADEKAAEGDSNAGSNAGGEEPLTISLPSGTYSVGATITIPMNVHVKGAASTLISGAIPPISEGSDDGSDSG